MDRTMSELGFDTDVLARHWWAIALRGLAAIIFGILAFAMPGVTLAVLVLLFGAYALVDGIFNIVAAVSGRSGSQSWWMVLLEGLVSVAAGLVTFFMPGLTALTLVYVISAWAIITGVLEIVAAIRLRKEITNEWWLALSGVLSIVFGALVAIAPGAGALALIFWIGAYAVVFGAMLVALGFRLRRLRGGAFREPMRRAA
ncbi:MAG TPA: HdeD family acid-resistance protein [Vicinamibacterales bacterium]|nr:HdeD family acid-resistance protein [Vicinamibacterales bacterium]